MKTKKLLATSVTALMACGLFGGIATPSYAASTSPNMSATDIQKEPAFWFNAEDGKRTFDVEGNSMVTTLVEGDTLKIEGNFINTYNSAGKLVASLKANIPDGVQLKYQNGVITAHDQSAKQATNNDATTLSGYKCIDNKWVSFGLGVVADGLVCAPLGVATGGVGGFACATAATAGITALSC